MQAQIGMIRQFRHEDAGACSRLVRACLRLDVLMPSSAREELIRSESSALMRERAHLFYVAVCVLESFPVGVAGVDMNEIRLLFVDPEHERKGIGGALLDHIEALVPPALFGNVFVYSAPGASGFYRVHGYQPGGAFGFDVGGTTMPTIYMTKRLTN